MSAESGRRAMLFSRLMDEHNIADLVGSSAGYVKLGLNWL